MTRADGVPDATLRDGGAKVKFPPERSRDFCLFHHEAGASQIVMNTRTGLAECAVYDFDPYWEPPKSAPAPDAVPATGVPDADLTAKLAEALREMVDTVQWMSGSEDFAEGHVAGEGWIKARPKLFAAMETIRAYDASRAQGEKEKE